MATNPLISTPNQTPPQLGVKCGYAPVNGLKIYYEICGAGRSLVLLHGGVGASEMFAPVLQTLAEHRQTVAVHLQGHGTRWISTDPYGSNPWRMTSPP